jgi:uncharacterized lipoprotein YddW (UPF0748 family)
LDWPQKPFQNQKDIENQKNELDRILDRLQETNINVVFFQTRMRGDVIYPSRIESYSEYVKSIYATTVYDPLLYAIEACHRRGLEFHAWFVVYPLGSETINKNRSRSGIPFNRKDCIKTFKKNVYLDPGNPETNAYLLSLLAEIVSTYDIDGIHLDYIRYPDTPARFPDQDTYKRYGNGKDKDDWRRENINRLVYAVYDTIKFLKPWVQLSSSVVGMYKEIEGKSKPHWTAFYSVYQDPVDWLEKGKHDFIVPMAYYSESLFFSFIEDWKSRNNGRFIVPGLGVFQMDFKELNWDAPLLYEQIEYSRKIEVQGNALFRVESLLSNRKGFLEGLQSRFYQYPALLPPLSWLSRTIPDPPLSLSAQKTGYFLLLEWDKVSEKENATVFYNVYRSETFPVDLTRPENLLAARLTDRYYKIQINDRIESGYYYVVTSYDRYHHESACSKPVYFITGSFEK